MIIPSFFKLRKKARSTRLLFVFLIFLYLLRPMTFCKISIPFDSHLQHGTVNIPVLSKGQFLENAVRINTAASLIFKQARSIIHSVSGASYLLFPNQTKLSQFTVSQNEGLKIVESNGSLCLGFIPFCKPRPQEQKENPVSKQISFWHYRLGDFSSPPKRVSVQASTACLFSLPQRFQLSQISSDQFCSIPNLSFLLLFHQESCALVCCEGPLPPVSRIPIFCSNNELEVQNFQPVEAKSLAVPFLMGKQNGTIHLPILSLDQWTKNREETPCKQKNLTKYNYFALSATLFVLPIGVTFDTTLGLQGLNCCILQNKYGFEIGFFPEKESKTMNNRILSNFQRALLEAVPQKSRNCYISGNECSSVMFDNFICLRAVKGSNIVTLKGGSFFLLASEDGRMCSFFCMRGNFELKCVRPTSPEEGICPITMLLEPPFSESSSAKKARIEEKGETSRRAIEKSKRDQVKEQGESSQRVVKESRSAEAAKKECADALLLFSQREQN